MPRQGDTGRKTHHGNRHESGIAGTGKRLAKSKSNGHLNGNLNGAHIHAVPSHSHAPSNSAGQHQVITPGEGHEPDGIMYSSKEESNGRPQTNGYEKATAVMSNGHSYPPASTNGGALPTTFGERTPTNVNRTGGSTSSLKKASSSGSVNPFSLASTILKSCPMYDTIAILIFLLQLPPIVLTLVQFLFASLTFMPPAGVSTNVLTSNFDIFQGPAGTPSLSTMIAMDGVCLLVWGLFMWTWAQNFAIDLAQVQVAITMGGGSSGKNEGVNAFCVMMVLIVHVLRSKGVQDFVIGHLLSAKLITTDTLAQHSHLIPQEFRRKEPPSPPSWLRSLLAVHILAQAGTAMARRSMAKNRSLQPSKPGKRTDTEASAGSHSLVDSSALESAANGSSILTSDGAAIGPLVLKENRERLSSAKKRRRQANQVRSRQPFWAALASTKVTVMREYDHSRNGTWSTHHPITEDDVEGFPLNDGFIWITQVDNSSIKFAASDFALMDDATYENGDQDVRSEPFYIKVNGAHWAPVTLSRAFNKAGEPSLVCWGGEISGLAPDCAYTCSFIRWDTDETISVMSVKTPPTPDTDQALSVPNISPSPRQSLRPSSPTTTIKNSIANAEAKLNERRARLKRSKNDHKSLISKLKKEVDNFNARLSGGSDENRQKQRLLQLERTIKQTEEATAAIDVQLQNLEAAPDEELEEWNSRKCAFDQEMGRVKSLKEEVDNARIMANRSISSVKSELTSVIQKRERLQGRQQRLSEQHERITSANNQGLNERERRVAEQLAKERERAGIEESFHDQLMSITRSIQDYQIRTAHLWQQVSAVEQAHQQQQQQQMLMSAGPLTPEGNLPGTNPPPLEASIPTMSAMPSTTRSLSGSIYTNFSTNETGGFTDRQTSLSPVVAPSQLISVDQQPHPSSSLATTDPFFGPELSTHRRRSLSNFSGTSVPVDQVMPRRPQDSPDSTVETTQKIAKNFGRGIRQFTRAGSQGSASGSGSGTGSGSASPHSSREKPSWC
ncbi:hypothetical protein AJ78_04987 [Emergomyces pasteurianus Ep9510]|uniref:Ubiquitination network signaling protein acrB n=1 Tax=Emergomyces pasteurianus Ep9510 TaxID=1447872 RepID=A0A1J9PDL8_9EURO|nr:hypothetical protein AJ78_04987 [Emergomyces pasteurianus Ep9510]